MRCKFCSYSNDVERKRDNADEIEVKRLMSILSEYKKSNGREMLISWIGGEPFLWKNIISFSKILFDNGIEVSTTTNGMILNDRDTLTSISKYFSEIVFSIDSFKECNDDVRCCKGHFDTVVRNIRMLNATRKEMNSKLKIKVNTILMRRNANWFEEFCSFLAELGVDEVTFNQLGGYDRPEFYDDNRLLTSQVEELVAKLPQMKKTFAEKGLLIHGSDKYNERILMTTRNEKNPISECNPGSWFWFINENGFISPCSYTSYEYMYNTKNVLCIEDVNKVEEYLREQRNNSRSHWCDDCYCTQVYDKFE
jgi:MoaA/NifB/PqqE/SkfB family radical SAM enzyme